MNPDPAVRLYSSKPDRLAYWVGRAAGTLFALDELRYDAAGGRSTKRRWMGRAAVNGRRLLEQRGTDAS